MKRLFLRGALNTTGVLNKVTKGDYTLEDIEKISKIPSVVKAKNQLVLRTLADRNDFQAVRTLLKNAPLGGADIHSNDDYVLRLFVREGHFDEARWLLTSKDIPENATAKAKDYMAFVSCGRSNTPKALEFLLDFLNQREKGFQKALDECFVNACMKGAAETIEFLCKSPRLKKRPSLPHEDARRAFLDSFTSGNKKAFNILCQVYGGPFAFNHLAFHDLLAKIISAHLPRSPTSKEVKNLQEFLSEHYKKEKDIEKACAIVRGLQTSKKIKDEIIYYILDGLDPDCQQIELKKININEVDFAPLRALCSAHDIKKAVEKIIDKKTSSPKKKM